MGNVLKCFEGEDDHAGGDHYPYYRPTSKPHYQPPSYSDSDGQPSIAAPRHHQQSLGPHGVMAATAGVPAQDQYIVNFKFTSMAAVPNSGHLQGSTVVHGNTVLAPQDQCNKRFSFKRVRDDYRDLSRVLHSLIRISGGDITKLPPDYKEFLALLVSDILTMKDEFLIVNNPALLPMSNRMEVFLMLYDRIVTYLGRTKARRAKKKRILSKLPYKNAWLDTAVANTQIKQYVVNFQKKYQRTQLDLLRLNKM